MWYSEGVKNDYNYVSNIIHLKIKIMKVKILGCGSGLDLSLGNTSVLVSNEGKNTLIDCGYTVLPKLFDLGIQDSIDNVFISHVHNDHAGSLCALLEYNCFVRGKKTRLGGVDLKPYLDMVGPTMWDMAVEKEEFEGVELIKTEHVPNMESVGALFFGKLFYSGDTGYSLLDSELAKRAEVIIHEAFISDMLLAGKKNEYIHVGMETLANSTDAETRAKTWITHYSRRNQELLKDMCSNLGFAGLLEPGQVINI